MTYTNNPTSKGRVTIPKEFRDHLGLNKAGKVQFNLNSRGEVVISRPLTDAELRAIVARPSGRVYDQATAGA